MYVIKRYIFLFHMVFFQNRLYGGYYLKKITFDNIRISTFCGRYRAFSLYFYIQIQITT